MCWQIDIPKFSWMNSIITRGMQASHLVKVQIRHRMEPVQARIKVKGDLTGLVIFHISPLHILE
jgi:hypothetical protein